MMKIKSGLLTSAVVLGMVLPLTLPVVANAADTDTEADKSASVTVTGGSLQIAKDTNGNQVAPSFNFTKDKDGNAIKVSTAAQKGLTADTFTNKDTTDKYTGSDLTVDDNTGTGAGWHVTAQLGAFSDGSHSLSGATLHLIPTGTKTDNGTAATATSTDLTAGDAATTTVFNAAENAGMGTSTTSLAGSTLDIPAASYAGTYTANLTYTLTSGPDSTSTTA